MVDPLLDGSKLLYYLLANGDHAECVLSGRRGILKRGELPLRMNFLNLRRAEFKHFMLQCFESQDEQSNCAQHLDTKEALAVVGSEEHSDQDANIEEDTNGLEDRMHALDVQHAIANCVQEQVKREQAQNSQFSYEKHELYNVCCAVRIVYIGKILSCILFEPDIVVKEVSREEKRVEDYGQNSVPIVASAPYFANEVPSTLAYAVCFELSFVHFIEGHV